MNRLFNETTIDQLVLNRERDAREYIKKLPEDSVLEQFNEHLTFLFNRNLFEMVELVGVCQTNGVVIKDVPAPSGGMYLSATVRGSAMTIEQEFRGDSELFLVAPSSTDFDPPQAWIDDSRSTLYFSVESIEQSASKLSEEAQRRLRQIVKYLQWLNADVENANSSLRARIESMLDFRRAEVKARRQLDADIGIKLKARNGPESTIVPLPKKRRLTTPSSTAPIKKSDSSATITLDDYNYILDVCKGMGIMMERAATSFVALDEEDLRHVFLAALNTHFEGQATAETFNKQGKTDILIKSKEHNVFVAECKNWNGAKSITEAISQVLSYLTWRDTRAAILIFNRDNKDFTKIVQQIPDIFRGHESIESVVLESIDTARFHYRMKKRDDHAIEIDLSVLAFDLPK